MKIFISTIVLFSSFILQSKEKLEIYFNVDDCTNCNNIIRFTKNIDSQINKFLYLSKDNEAIIEEIFKNLELSQKDFNIGYLPNDFFQCKKKNCQTRVLSSYCIYVDGSEKKDSFSLKELPGKISRLKKNKWQNQEGFEYRADAIKDSIHLSLSNLSDIGKTKSFSLLIPDSIKFSKRIRIFIRDSMINILDGQLNKNITLFLNKNFSEIKKIILVKGHDFNPGPFVALNCFDTTFYRGNYSRIKSMGRHIPVIESAFATDTTIQLMLNLAYVRHPDPNSGDSLRLRAKVHPLTVHDTILDMRYFIYTKNIKTNRDQLQFFNKESYEQDKYWLLSLAFFFEKDKLFASIHSWDKPNDDIFLGEFKTLNNRFEFNRLHTNTTNNIKIENLAKNQILHREVNSSFYYTTSMPFFFDFRRNEDFLLDKNDFDPNEKMFIKDVLRDKDKLYVLVTEGEQIFQYTFNNKTKKREDKKQINLESLGKQTNIKFLDNHKYLIIDGNKLQILDHSE